MRPETDTQTAASARPSDARSMPDLIATALRDMRELALKEYDLFRAEMSDNLTYLVTGIVGLVAAAIFVIVTLVLLTAALVAWVATLVDSEALASLIVAAGTFVVAVILMLMARSALSKASLQPRHTIRSVERDAHVVTERMRA